MNLAVDEAGELSLDVECTTNIGPLPEFAGIGF